MNIQKGRGKDISDGLVECSVADLSKCFETKGYSESCTPGYVSVVDFTLFNCEENKAAFVMEPDAERHRGISFH
mgnify:CR=1 FL=1